MLSVIIPCYGAFDYLREIADDLLNQCFRDFEVVFVNDGDHRQDEILAEIVSTDKRLKAVYKENGGVSSARNCGLDNVNGEWIVMVDPDDRIEPYYLESLYNTVADGGADLGVGGFKIANDRMLTKCTERLFDKDFADKRIVSISDYFDYTEYMCDHRSVWNKIYKREIIEKYELRFDEQNKAAEDWKFNLDYYNVIKKVGLVRDCGYYYIWGNDGSQILSYYSDPVNARMRVVDKTTTLRRTLGRPESRVQEERRDDIAQLCFAIIKNLFCTRNHPDIRNAVKYIKNEILPCEEMMNAVASSKHHKKTDLLQKYILLTRNAYVIAVMHKMLYVLKNLGKGYC